MSKWRLIPKLSYHKYNNTQSTWNDWLWIHRKWSGKLIYIHIKNHEILFDFRKDFIADIME